MSTDETATDDLTGTLARVLMAMTLMRTLKGVMATENELLRQLRVDRLLDVQVEKAALVAGYEAALEHLRRSPELHGGVSDIERCVLETGVRELAASARCNRQRLAEARAAIHELIEAIDCSLAMISDGAGLTPRPRLASGG